VTGSPVDLIILVRPCTPGSFVASSKGHWIGFRLTNSAVRIAVCIGRYIGTKLLTLYLFRLYTFEGVDVHASLLLFSSFAHLFATVTFQLYEARLMSRPSAHAQYNNDVGEKATTSSFEPLYSLDVLPRRIRLANWKIA
jgi:hypothetical protein